MSEASTRLLPDGSEDRPNPPRYRRLRRLAILTGMVVALIVVARWVWGMRVERELSVAIADLRTRGEPALPGDLQKPPFAPRQRPAPDLYGQALAAQATFPSATEWASGQSDGDVAEMLKIASENAAARALVRQARLARAGMSARMGNSSLAQSLAIMLRNCALAEHYAGNDAEAVELLRDELALAKAMDDRAQTDFACIDAEGLSASGCEDASRLAETLTVDGHNPSFLPGMVPMGAMDLRRVSNFSRPPKPATVEQIHALIDELLDEQVFAAGALRVLRFVNASNLSSTDPAVVAALIVQPAWKVRLLWPMIRRKQLDNVRQVAACQQALQQSRFTAGADLVPHSSSVPPAFAALPLLSEDASFIARTLDVRYSRILQSVFGGSAMRHATAVLLAIHLYEMDHDMRLPKSLANLSPTYMKSIPSDPFRGDGKTFGYQIDTPSPFIYSVSIDGVDDSGSTGSVSIKAFVWWDSQGPDQRFYIHWRLGKD